MSEIVNSRYELHTDARAVPKITPAAGAAAQTEQIAAASFPRLAGLLRTKYPAWGLRFAGSAEYCGSVRKGLTLTVEAYEQDSGTRVGHVEALAGPPFRVVDRSSGGPELADWLKGDGLDEVKGFLSFQL